MPVRRDAVWFAAVLAAVALWLCYDIVSPFLKPLLTAAFIAIAVYPLHIWIKRHVPGENRPALVTTLIVLLTVIFPAIFLGGVVVEQGRALYSNIVAFIRGGGLDRLVERIHNSPLARFGIEIPSVGQINDLVQGNAERLSRLGLSLAGNLIGNVTALIAGLFFVMFFLFFCLRDGESIFRRLASLAPLTIEQVHRLADTVHDTMRASVYGILAVGIAQGAITGGSFALLGLPSSVFWGVCAGFASIVPAVGSTMIWIPGAIYLMLTGHVTKGIVLLFIGAGLISTVDNIIRPLVIQGRVRMGTLAVFISLLGGIQAFGLIGLFAGPLIFTSTAEVLKILREEIEASRTLDHARQP